MEPTNKIPEIAYKLFGNIIQGEHKGYAIGGMVTGGIYSACLFGAVQPFWTIFTVAFFLKGILGLGYVGISGIVTKAGVDVWNDKIKPKIKMFRHGKEENDDDHSRRA
jgi:hypothetical protein